MITVFTFKVTRTELVKVGSVKETSKWEDNFIVRFFSLSLYLYLARKQRKSVDIVKRSVDRLVLSSYFSLLSDATRQSDTRRYRTVVL